MLKNHHSGRKRSLLIDLSRENFCWVCGHMKVEMKVLWFTQGHTEEGGGFRGSNPPMRK